MLKLFSFKKPVLISSGDLIVNDLAYNHNYVKAKRYGKKLYKNVGESKGVGYVAFYDAKGEMFLLETKFCSLSKALLPWKSIRAVVVIQKILANGDTFVLSNHYQTTDFVEKELVQKVFTFVLNNVEYSTEFAKENGKWTSKGNVPSEIRLVWLKNLCS